MPEVERAWSADPTYGKKFPWLANHKPFKRACELTELPEMHKEFCSYAEINITELPDEEYPADINLFFVDLRDFGPFRWECVFCFVFFSQLN